MNHFHRALYLLICLLLPVSLWTESLQGLSPPSSAIVIGFLYLPLWLLAPGILRMRYTANILLCFLVLFYFAIDVARVAGRWPPLGMTAVLLETALFVTALLSARSARRH